MKSNPLIEYRRNLPHIQPKDAKFFISFRLYGSIPLAHLDAMSQKYLHDKNLQSHNQHHTKATVNAQEAYFKALDDFLDMNPIGPYYLADEQIAHVVKEALHYRDAKDYSLICYCLMSNHVHLIISDLSKPLHIVMKELKGFTGKTALKILQSAVASDLFVSEQAHRDPIRKKFWQPESFDRIIRDNNDLHQKIQYTINNPVKAGLVNYWSNWPNTYLASEFME